MIICKCWSCKKEFVALRISKRCCSKECRKKYQADYDKKRYLSLLNEDRNIMGLDPILETTYKHKKWIYEEILDIIKELCIKLNSFPTYETLHRFGYYGMAISTCMKKNWRIK